MFIRSRHRQKKREKKIYGEGVGAVPPRRKIPGRERAAIGVLPGKKRKERRWRCSLSFFFYSLLYQRGAKRSRRDVKDREDEEAISLQPPPPCLSNL